MRPFDRIFHVCERRRQSLTDAHMMHTLGPVILLSTLDQEKPFFHVEQTPQASAPLGDPVQLNCSVVSKNECLQRCPSKRNVHWFRAGASASAASVMYTYESRSDKQLQRTCVYSLSTTIETYEDTGPYYCAVAACGHVLFGAGTNVNISSDRLDLLPVCAALGLLLICSTVANALMLCRVRKAAHANGLSASKHLEILDTNAADQSNVEEDTITGMNYAVLDLPRRKVKRSNIQTGSPSECLYSAPRAHR
uniref:Ig-like domain-containing protein n=1 Tax=Knipowitschia caucasica TaxID=637954 RepID=A0AAV2MHT9_KNICA